MLCARFIIIMYGWAIKAMQDVLDASDSGLMRVVLV
jgi:hypothetical protein